MKPRTEEVDRLLKAMPDNPGVYQYFDEEGTLMYVGKAKNLKKRVSSYFNKDKHQTGKTAVLVRKIRDIKYIIVDTEYEALLLENSLIKKHQPKYNINLKDDKTYPWLCIKKERFPRVFSTRLVIKDGSEYFGPYPSVRTMRGVLELIKQLYPLRNCTYLLSEANIEAGKFKTCLEYQIGNCKGACEGLQEEAEYNHAIQQIRELLKGNVKGLLKVLKEEMQTHAAALEFEAANKAKERYGMLERFQGKSTVVNPKIDKTDVFSIQTDEKFAYVNYMRVANGAIVQGQTLEMKKGLEETDQELLTMAIAELRQRFRSASATILVPFLPGMDMPDAEYHVPQRGDKAKLLQLSERNVKQYMHEKRKAADKANPEHKTSRILTTLQTDLRLTELPKHIECFDNSNFQGAEPVAACVVFKNAKPAKRDYRHFNIKTVVGPDDFASMEEVVYRRYKRLQDEEQPMPQLIVVDGGKGQLSAAVTALDKLGLRGKIGIIGIAKRLEEIYFPGDSIPLYLDKRSESLKVIQHLRNEAHRFGITHHRKRRGKATIKSELTGISGVGPETLKELLRHFKSVKRIKGASLKELEAVIPLARAKRVFEHFQEGE